MKISFNKNSRNLTIKANHIEYLENKIVINNAKEIKLKDKVELDLLIKDIDEKYKTYMIMNSFSGIETECLVNEFEWTDNHIFLLPFLNSNKQQLGTDEFLCSPYLYYKDDNKEFNFIYLLYRFYPFKFYSDFIESIKKNNNFVTLQSYQEDKRFDIVTFKTNEEFREDLNKIIEGKYMNISNNAKYRISKFHGYNKNDLIFNVIYNTETLRKQMEIKLGTEIPKELSLRNKIKKEDLILN